MNIFSTTILVLAAFTCCFATTPEARNQRNDDLEMAILEVVQDNREVLEPVRIADHGYSFHHQFRNRNLTGEAKFIDIKMFGLSTLRRSGDCFVERTRIGNYLVMAKLAVGPLKYNMTGKVNLFGIGPLRQFYGRIVHLDADMTIMYSKATDSFSLKKLSINEINGLSVSMHQRWYSMSDAIINQVMKRLINRFETITRHTIESAFSKMLQSSVNKSKILRRMIENEIGHASLTL
jgi:hypothetical protein